MNLYNNLNKIDYKVLGYRFLNNNYFNIFIYIYL